MMAEELGKTKDGRLVKRIVGIVRLVKKYLSSPSPLSSPRWGEEVYEKKNHLKGGFFNSPIVAVLSLVVFGLIITPSSADEPQFRLAPLNPEFEEYMEKYMEKVIVGEFPRMRTDAGEGHALGLIPPPLDMSHTKGLSIISVSQPEPPSTYDLRGEGRLTDVSNQGVCGSCWTFATYASLESWIRGEEDAIWDFSENNLKECSGFDWGACIGGNHLMSTAYLTRWSGPVAEIYDPYEPSEAVCVNGLTVEKHIETVLWPPDRDGSLENDDKIKQTIMDYGAMYTTMCFGESYFVDVNNYYYYYDGPTTIANHAVAIVGWDDNMAKGLFEAQNDGAWIIKNSHGTVFGEEGYFYISYDDDYIGKDNASFIDAVEPASTIYQYDPLGAITSMGVEGSNTMWGANIFTATGDECLNSVGFYALTVNTSYSIYIYDTLGNGNLLGSKSGSFIYPGYHTVDLTTPVCLADGGDFAVAIKFTTPGLVYPVPIETPVPDYSSGATANRGESYISDNGDTWEDVTIYSSDTNVCIKAFAQPCDDIICYTLNVISDYGSPVPAVGPHAYAGKSLECSVASPVSGRAGVRYICTGYEGTGDVPASGTETSVNFNISQDSTITWKWRTEYPEKSEGCGCSTIGQDGSFESEAGHIAGMLLPVLVVMFAFIGIRRKYLNDKKVTCKL